jgi:hypothetical protein
VKAAREDWFERQPDLDPDRLVFLDETAATTKMVRRYGRLHAVSAAGSPYLTGTIRPPPSPPPCAPRD